MNQAAGVPFERRFERTIIAAGLGLLVLLAWWWLWRGAGMGMSGLQMTQLALFPHRQLDPMAGMPEPTLTYAAVAAMWWVMMIAMMTPAVTPLVMLYRRVAQHHAGDTSQWQVASAFWLLLGYLLAWFAFALLAAALQFALRDSALISGMVFWSRSGWLSAALLIGAGLYQLSPWKQRCLAQCRGPVNFLTRHARPGIPGALRLGLLHGAWCIGCCGVLMLLLFVGGVMNLVWIALLSLLVLAEKVLPAGAFVARLAGVFLVAWGLATLLIGSG